ncbi:protein eiger isoform X1 [Osmia bicornis bicornis]|uniref:protein eiger isoform X1 n=1 Tax=Osmia bicornis bicornis TaxID=1437191 RepID=UPI001EAEA395|nr:protein eiger isoform X1 [Osmia bicornis bicornis]XP_029049779.2 protein eiger isoform X1 [Osmia bicornis bicornis]XP_046143805.1 protein eiger isoform X1 [Osmia bicornis bicornis]XP_046143806.1 protein eiger isoform X1 [Osmia bicornis bicornis]XP_046143807.1 protein eiger isoform X1 [Osmia bicornis bicornis]XP_046143808.1 protein eiger isoform X1 [Osmia bicornis bicornis]
MTSMLPEEGIKITRMKEKLMNDVHGKEESRSFLSFSRENLSISQSELEKGFNKYRFRPTRHTILSIAALSIALLCLALESWKFHWTMVNAREIEELKRSVENLKHRFLEKDLLDEVKVFEEQLYAEESDDDGDGDDDDDDNDNDNDGDDNDPGDLDIDNADYDSNYDDVNLSSHDYSLDYHTGPTYGARPSDFPDSLSTIAPVPSPPEAASNKAMIKWLTAMRKYEMKHSREGHSHDRTKKLLKEKSDDRKNNTKEKRDVLDRGNAKNFLIDWKMNLKRKRSIEEGSASEKSVIINHNRTFLPKDFSHLSVTNSSSAVEFKILSVRPVRPKKYYSSVKSVSDNRKRSLRKLRKNLGRSRKNVDAPQQIFAVHYGGDKNAVTINDEHTGNGRIRHADQAFTSWKANDWVNDLGMNNHFNLSKNGSVVVYKSGLYLAYAQIVYTDRHDEVGFHLLVNNEPILQCLIDNSGTSHIHSQSCFSAQVTRLNKDDVVQLKEISSPKFVLFNKENSFFGLVKLGEFHNSK